MAEQASEILQYHGFAAEDIEAGTIYLNVHIPELTPALAGGVGAASAPSTITTKNPNGVSESVVATASNVLRCKWDGEANRALAPTVRKGESILVVKRLGIDEYRWTSPGRDPKLRTTETHRISVGAAPGRAQEKSNENSYFVELDSETNQTIHIHMAAANGEKTTLDIRMDGKNGVIVITDQERNMYLSDIAKKQVQISNSQGCVVQLIDKNVIIEAVEDLVLKAGRQVVYKAPVATFENAGGSGTMVVKAQGLSLEADAITMKGGTVGIDGALKAAGPVVTGPLRAEGYATGSAGAAYPASSTDIAQGSGTSNKPAPDNAESSGQRHAAAWEQVQEGFVLCKQLFDMVFGKIGTPEGQELLLQLAEAAKMPKNLGE